MVESPNPMQGEETAPPGRSLMHPSQGDILALLFVQPIPDLVDEAETLESHLIFPDAHTTVCHAPGLRQDRAGKLRRGEQQPGIHK
jgi:hypothetical protein